MRTRPGLILLTLPTLLLAALPIASGHVQVHGHKTIETNPVGGAMIEHFNAAESAHRMDSYFRHGPYSGWNVAHATLMVIAWVIIMPLAILLSVARSRYHIPTQVLFHVVNGLGVFAGFAYNKSTPDLYVRNAHHPIGWVVVASTIVWTLTSIYVAFGTRRDIACLVEDDISIRSAEQRCHVDMYEGRYSRDSGHGTERHSASLLGSRQNSCDSTYQELEEPMGRPAEGGGKDTERESFMMMSPDGFISKALKHLLSRHSASVLRILQIGLEKVLLLLGFAALLSGFIVSGGLFRGREIFSGLAHYIKGGIFFWYGLLTLGRWMGAFSEFGWAWNVRPQYPLVSKWKSRIPSAEFTESFVIWLYGATNVFLEHLNNWGKDWSPQDLEHVSITILFFGGGLLGMVIESSWVRDLTNTPVIMQRNKKEEQHQIRRAFANEPDEWSEPQTYRFPMNPMPATTIMLLGMMMGAHHQSSMVSTMMHAQWGGLFTAFALARATTYVLMYIKPPTSNFACRPPSELVAAFCLTSGGIIFMNSASDIVAAIEENGLDAMTIFTLTMGLTGIIMTLQIVAFAVKGWAVRKERAAAGSRWDDGTLDRYR